MRTAVWITAITPVLTGLTFGYAGRWIRRTRRADLIFAPGITVPDQESARIGGCGALLAGIATVALGIGVLLVTPETTGWLLLLGPYTAVCLSISFGSWYYLRRVSAP